jgi:hypothetical protein
MATNMFEEFDKRGPSTCQIRLSVKILNYLTAKSNGLPIRGTPHSFTQFGFRQPMHLCTGVSEEGDDVVYLQIPTNGIVKLVRFMATQKKKLIGGENCAVAFHARACACHACSVASHPKCGCASITVLSNSYEGLCTAQARVICERRTWAFAFSRNGVFEDLPQTCSTTRPY